MTPLPPGETTQFMRFIAEKVKNVKSPMNMMELSRQFKEETRSLVSERALKQRIDAHRNRIYKMNEFDMDTRVKMIFALSAPIVEGFLNELKKVAHVKVDDNQRIIYYRQKNGGLELRGNHWAVPTRRGEQRNREIIQFLAKTSETTDSPIPDRLFARKFKETTGCSDSIESIEYRYRRIKNTIFELPGIIKSTKIRMMFLSHAKLSDDILKELRNDADVEIDEEGRITKYKSKNGSLELEGRSKYSHAARWSKICEKVNNDESKEDKKKATNWQKGYETNRTDFVRFLIKRAKDAKYPMSIHCLAADFKIEFRSSESQKSIVYRIENFRQRICSLNQFDIPTKVKMMFALSAPVDTKFLQVIQKDGFVELDEMKRIKKYKAIDGSLELEGDHSFSANIRAREVSALSGSIRERYSQSTSLSQLLASIQKESKRVKSAHSFSEVFEEKDDDEESMTREMMEYDTNSADDGRYDYFYHDPSYYEDDIDHIQMDKKSESLIEVKAEESSTSIVGQNYERNFFDYDPSTYEKDLEHYPKEKKPETFVEVKLEVPEESSTNNLESHYEDILTEPKSE